MSAFKTAEEHVLHLLAELRKKDEEIECLNSRIEESEAEKNILSEKLKNWSLMMLPICENEARFEGGEQE